MGVEVGYVPLKKPDCPKLLIFALKTLLHIVLFYCAKKTAHVTKIASELRLQCLL